MLSSYLISALHKRHISSGPIVLPYSLSFHCTILPIFTCPKRRTFLTFCDIIKWRYSKTSNIFTSLPFSFASCSFLSLLCFVYFSYSLFLPSFCFLPFLLVSSFLLSSFRPSLLVFLLHHFISFFLFSLSYIFFRRLFLHIFFR